MKIAVIHDAPVPTTLSRQLLYAIMRRGHEAVYVRLSRLVPGVINGEAVVLRSRSRRLEIDGGIVRGIGIANPPEEVARRIDILRILEGSGTVLINPVQPTVLARDKLATTFLLARAGIPVPDTVVVDDPYEAHEIVKSWGKVVMKPMQGSMGYGARLVSDPDTAFIVAKMWTSLSMPVYIQKFMRDRPRDIRAFVVDGEFLGAIYRYAPKGGWKTNVSQGGKSVKADVDAEVEELAIKAAEVLGLVYAGVDIGEVGDSYVVYEVNSVPSWAGFEAATGISPADDIVRSLLIRIRK